MTTTETLTRWALLDEVYAATVAEVGRDRHFRLDRPADVDEVFEAAFARHAAALGYTEAVA